MKIVTLTKQPVDLFKILKFEGLVNSGGEAKALISEGHVKLNGLVETQKSKKIVDGDLIEFDQEQYKIECASPPSLAPAAKPKQGRSKVSKS